MATCKIYVRWKFDENDINAFADGTNLFTTLFDTNDNGKVDENDNWGFNDYISEGGCANFSGSDDFKNKGKNSCSTEYRRPLNGTKWYVDSTSYDDDNGKKKVYDNGSDAYNAAWPYICKDSSYGRYACLDIENMPAPIFETGSTLINPTDSLTWAYSTDDFPWDNYLSESINRYNLQADYKVDGINKLYVSEKYVDTDNNTTLFKLDISNDKTILYNEPWKFLLNPIEDNSDLTDIFEKIEFWVELDNDTQSEYILEPECWGADNPCELESPSSGDSWGDSSGGSSGGTWNSNNNNSSNSGVVILLSVIGVIILLLIVGIVIFIALKNSPPSIE